MSEYWLLRLIMAGGVIGLAAALNLMGEIGAGRFPSHVCQKGDSGMMDLTMIGTLGVSFGMVWLLVRWCQKQLDDPEA